jgi:Bacterial Ig-like domain (group 3)/Kelch motif
MRLLPCQLFSRIVLLIAIQTLASAQQPGANVDVLPAYPNGNASPPFPPPPITLTDATRGDGYLQRQVEPTVAPSTYNPDHILAAFGDYRTTSIPNDTGLPGTAASGWIGLSRSYDRGHTWFGSLVPCFPQDPSKICSKSPLTGLQSGSDPTLATTPGGHFYLGALFFTPGHISNVAVVHYRDVPDADGGDTIRYQGAVIVDKGSVADSGNFIDKPGIAADIARGTASASVCGPVYIAYTIFVGGGGAAPFTSKVGFSRSRQGSCGSSWDHQLYLNKNYKQNQGTAIGVDPRNGKIYVVWRHIFQLGGDGFPDSILMATSTDRGASFSDPVPITRSSFAPIDQPGLATTNFPNNPAFRSNSFPSIAVDGNGNVYVADQEKVFFSSDHPAGYYEPRVVIRTLRSGAGSSTTGSIVDPGTGAAQQFMPVLSFAGGLLKVLWYDFREQNQVSDNVAGGWFVTGLDRQMKTYVAQSNLSAFDIFGNPVFSSSVPVTQYLTEVNTGQLPTVGDYVGPGSFPAVNRPNLPMYSAGTTPFTGDYIGMMTASPFVATPGGPTAFRWATNPTDYIAMPSFGVWTDSRDVVFPTFNFGKPTLNDPLGWTQYAPPGTGSSCTNAGSRNANVYLSEITPGVIAGSPATSRQLVDASGAPMERAFPIYIQNPNTDVPNHSPAGKFFRISFNNLNSPLAGSFAQGTELQGPTTSVDLNILQYSSATVTLYVYCSSCSSSRPLVPFAATVQEIDALGGQVISGGAQTTIFFDSDPTSPFVTNTNLGTNEFHNASVSNPQYTNPQYTNPQYTNPQYTNPQYTNPQYTNPQYTNVAPSDAVPVADFVWTVTDLGNNASAYTAVANIANNPNYIYETIISRTYNFPGFSGCKSQPIPQDAIISIIPNPQYTNPQYTNPQYTNPQYTNPQYTNASFAAVPPPPGNTASAATTTSSTSISTSTDDGTTKMPLATDHVYFVLRVYRAGGDSNPLTPSEQSAVIANTTLLVFPQAPTTGTGTPIAQPPAPANTNKSPSSTSLASSPNPSVFGQPVTFTAAVTPASAVGTVDFKEGSTLLGTAAVSSGTATFSTSSLSVGTHNITAIYSGDTNFVGSVSNTVTQTVKFPSWSSVAQFNDPRTSTGIEGSAASLINGKIYVSHGYRNGDSNLLSIYDIATNTWTHGGPSAPDAVSIRSELAGATDGSKHYAIGGRGATTLTDVEVFDPSTNTWSAKTPMPSARAGLAAVFVNGKIYAIGGRDQDTYGAGTLQNANEAYDIGTDTWATKASMPTPLSDIYATVAFNGKIYVFGGATGQSGVSNLVQIYDPVADSWTTGTPMPTARGAAMAAVIDGRIAVFGGVSDAVGSCNVSACTSANLAVTEVYDPGTDAWSSGTALTTAASEMAAGVVSDGTKAFAIGSGIFGIAGSSVQELGYVPPVIIN